MSGFDRSSFLFKFIPRHFGISNRNFVHILLSFFRLRLSVKPCSFTILTPKYISSILPTKYSPKPGFEEERLSIDVNFVSIVTRLSQIEERGGGGQSTVNMTVPQP